MDEAAEQQVDRKPAPPTPTAPDEPEVAWIHSLAGEWQSRWQRVQYPHARSGASLLK